VLVENTRQFYTIIGYTFWALMPLLRFVVLILNFGQFVWSQPLDPKLQSFLVCLVIASVVVQ
jgi:hypothetical protein